MKLPTVSELESSNGTVPEVLEDAKNLAIDSCRAFNVMTTVDIRTSIIHAKELILFDEDSYDETWDDTFPNGGTILTRSRGGSKLSYDASNINVLVIKNDDTTGGIFTDILCSEGGRDFILNGVKIYTQNNGLTISFRSADDMLLDASLSLEGDMAYSVKVKDSAIGAKILINFKTDKIIFSVLTDDEVNAEVKNALKAAPATISVYDDANELKHTFTDVPLGDIFPVRVSTII
jgi:hypothetical protein